VCVSLSAFFIIIIIIIIIVLEYGQPWLKAKIKLAGMTRAPAPPPLSTKLWCNGMTLKRCSVSDNRKVIFRARNLQKAANVFSQQLKSKCLQSYSEDVHWIVTWSQLRHHAVSPSPTRPPQRAVSLWSFFTDVAHDSVPSDFASSRVPQESFVTSREAAAGPIIVSVQFRRKFHRSHAGTRSAPSSDGSADEVKSSL